MRTLLASAADQSAVSFRPSQGAGARRQFVVFVRTAGRGTRFACVPFSDVVSARRAIVLVVPAAGSSGRLVTSVPVCRSGILLCGNEGLSGTSLVLPVLPADGTTRTVARCVYTTSLNDTQAKRVPLPAVQPNTMNWRRAPAPWEGRKDTALWSAADSNGVLIH